MIIEGFEASRPHQVFKISGLETTLSFGVALETHPMVLGSLRWLGPTRVDTQTYTNPLSLFLEQIKLIL